MNLAPGARLGPYEIVGLLGSGGMGEVYRARDPRLARDVAIKILPASLSRDADRLRRFEQEARAAGALNHPNITAVHDIGTEDGTTFVVCELLEGETLRARLALGPLPTRKVLDHARQIALGLAAAHEKGIVHRDLKPENLFVTRDGRLKILDFGLAKLTPDERQGGGEAPTMAIDTEPGVVLGTVGYMSPEQVRGRPADHRSDLFAFGAVLYEMISGRRAFQGDTAADTMSAILKEDPPELTAGTATVPPGLERIVRHCLEKSPDERFRSAHDLAFQLEALSELSGGTPAMPGPKRGLISPRVGIAAVALLALGWAIGAMFAVRSATPPLPEAPTLSYLTFSGDDWEPAASPDGKLVAFVSDRDGRDRIWLKELASGNEIALTEGRDATPRFSRDGSSVFFRRTEGEANRIYRVPVLGGEARRVLDDAFELSPSPDGRTLAFVRGARDSAGSHSALWLSSADGTGPRRLFEIEGADLSSPAWSPDGQQIAAIAQSPGTSKSTPRLLLIDAVSGQERSLSPRARRGLLGRLTWAPMGDALVYSQIGVVSQGDFTGISHLICQPVRGGEPRTLLSFPRPMAVGGLDLLGSGRIVVDTEASRQNLKEVELRGGSAEVGRFLTHGNATDRQPCFSPDGEWIAFTSARGGNQDVWTISPASGTLRRLTDHPDDDWDPAFTPDATRLLWSSNRTGHFEIWIANADGSSPRQLTQDGVDAQNPTATHDSEWVVYDSGNPEQQGLWKVRTDGTQATRLLSGEALHPEVSPDGRYALSFSSTRDWGRVLRVHAVQDGRYADFQIRGLDDSRARWMPDGGAIAFLDRDDRGSRGIFVQEFRPGSDTAGSRRPLAGFDSELDTESFGIAPDGSRIVLAQIEWGSALLLAEGIAGLPDPASPRR